MKQANLSPEPAYYRIDLNDKPVEFTLKRCPKRRHIGLRVDQHGLTVTAPIKSSEHFIRRTLADHADWILKKIKTWSQYWRPPLAWCDGETVPYLGNDVRLNVLIHPRAKTGATLDLTGIVVESRRPLEAPKVKEMVIDWYRSEARRHLPARLRALAEGVGIAPPRFFLSNADGRWGSCNVKGDIRLNWRLMKAPPEVIDYVSAHELAHLKHMDHGAAFWRTVAEIYPGFETPRALLQQHDVYYRLF
jgi:predicted metal-dependent hydrolase